MSKNPDEVITQIFTRDEMMRMLSWFQALSATDNVCASDAELASKLRQYVDSPRSSCLLPHWL